MGARFQLARVRVQRYLADVGHQGAGDQSQRAHDLKTGEHGHHRNQRVQAQLFAYDARLDDLAHRHGDQINDEQAERRVIIADNQRADGPGVQEEPCADDGQHIRHADEHAQQQRIGLVHDKQTGDDDQLQHEGNEDLRANLAENRCEHAALDQAEILDHLRGKLAAEEPGDALLIIAEIEGGHDGEQHRKDDHGQRGYRGNGEAGDPAGDVGRPGGDV